MLGRDDEQDVFASSGCMLPIRRLGGAECAQHFYTTVAPTFYSIPKRGLF